MSKYSLDYLRNHTVIGDILTNGLPWTARALNIAESNAFADTAEDGSQWLYPSAVPVNVARALLDRFAVVSHPLSFIRPAMPWDDPKTMVTIDGQSYTVVTDSTRQVIADAKTDRVHFVPKDGYTVHPFTESLIDRTARIVGDGPNDLHIDSVGVLASGGEAWVSIATGSLLTLPEGVDYYPHILSAGSHNGTLASTFAAVVTMTVCDNTRAMALAEGKHNGTMSKIKHTRMSAERMAKAEDESRAALGLLESASENFAAQVAEWCAIPVTDSQFSNWLTSELFPIPDDASKNITTRNENNRETVTEIYRTDARAAQWNGTAFGALQSINTFDLWERGTRGGTDAYTRTVREAITGQLDTREAERADSLMRVLANV